MNTPTRRASLLAVLAGVTLASPVVVASAIGRPDPDAELVRLAADFLRVLREAQDETDMERADLLDEERIRLRDALVDMEPATPAGFTALARVAYRDDDWSDAPFALALVTALLAQHDPAWMAAEDAHDEAKRARTEACRPALEAAWEAEKARRAAEAEAEENRPRTEAELRDMLEERRWLLARTTGAVRDAEAALQAAGYSL